MHRQLFLTLKINTIKTRKVRKKDIENNNHESNKHRDSRNKRRGDPRRIWQECMAQQNITRKKIFLAIVRKKKNAPMINIIKKKWEEGDLGTTMTTGWALQAAFITFRVASKVWKKIWFELITFFYQIVCSSLFQS